MATLTTVGYGDVYPATPLGKILAGGVAFIDNDVIAITTGIVAGAFANAMVRPRIETKKLRGRKNEEGPWPEGGAISTGRRDPAREHLQGGDE